jgi:hypothetical protein
MPWLKLPLPLEVLPLPPWPPVEVPLCVPCPVPPDELFACCRPSQQSLTVLKPLPNAPRLHCLPVLDELLLAELLPPALLLAEDEALLEPPPAALLALLLLLEVGSFVTAPICARPAPNAPL